MVETIAANGVVLCHILRLDGLPAATSFETPVDCALQVGHVVHPAGHEIPRHVHLPVDRHLTRTGEVLLVRRGSLECDVYDDDLRFVSTHLLRTGDLLVMEGGGHAFRMLEDTVLLEVKQGPYAGPDEKRRF